MVIQRLQSLLLILAVAMCAVAMFMPVATVGAAPLYLTDMPVLMTVDIVVAVLLFIAIFMFKNLKLQMRVTLVSMLLICAVAIGGGFYLWRNAPEASVEYAGSALMMLCALIAAAVARRFMRRDYNLLRSADRLR